MAARALYGGSRVLMLRGYESADGFSNVMPSGFAENGTKIISGWLNYYTIEGSYIRVTVEADGLSVGYT